MLVQNAGSLRKGYKGGVFGRIQGGRAVDYIRRFIEKHRYGRWKEILIGYAILCLLSGLASAWGSRHFLSSFALWTLTHALYLPVIFLCLGLSIWVGMYAGRISRLTIVGWVVGIAAFAIVSWTIPSLVGQIPGIGWRFLAILNSPHSDY
jgi:hypothetical protein